MRPLVLTACGLAAVAVILWAYFASVRLPARSVDPGPTFAPPERSALRPDPAANDARDATAAAAPRESRVGPTAADAVRLLRAFDWTVEEALAAVPGFGADDAAALVADVAAADGDDHRAIRATLAAIEAVGLEGGAAQDDLARWAGDAASAPYARSAVRILAHGSEAGRALAVSLASALLDRATADPDDRSATLFAWQALDELAAARVPEALPVLQQSFADAVADAQGAVAELEHAADVASRGGDVSAGVLDRIAAHQRAIRLAVVLLALDSGEAAAWARDVLETGTPAPTGAWAALVEALPDALDRRPDGPVAEALSPWALERLRAGIDHDDAAAPAVYRAAAAAGSAALPLLRQAAVDADAMAAQEHAVIALARAAEAAPSGDDVGALWSFVDRRGGRSAADAVGPAQAAERAAWAFVARHGNDLERTRLVERAIASPPATAMRLLEELPASAWQGREAELVAFVERLAPAVDGDAEADRAVELALERLVGNASDPRAALLALDTGSSDRLAERLEDARRALDWRAASDVPTRLALLTRQLAEGVHPFRGAAGEPSPFDRAVELVRTAAEPDVALLADALADDGSPVGLRVALARGFALRGALAPRLGDALVAVVRASASEAARALPWAHMHQLAHWKTVAWCAVTRPLEHAAVAACVAAQAAAETPRPPARLAERLSLLSDYVASLERAGWDRLDAQLHADADGARFAASRAELDAAYLAHVAGACALPLRVRLEAVTELDARKGAPVELAEVVARAVRAEHGDGAGAWLERELAGRPETLARWLARLTTTAGAAGGDA